MNTSMQEAPCVPAGTVSLCVYCGARDGVHADFVDAAHRLGHGLGQRGAQLVYGGGRTGLMGVVARAAQAASSRVVGIIPQALVQREVANTACEELIVVPNMHQRKALMAERSQAFIALPGGVGTLEELFEVWTWRQLGYHDKPIGILNIKGYYDPLLEFIHRAQMEGFVSGADKNLVIVENDVDILLNKTIAAMARSQPMPSLAEKI